jgi:hypothetical protein
LRQQNWVSPAIPRQQLHARIAEALETHSPEMMENQPELFAQYYAEAGLVEKAVAYWSKAGRRSAARSAMAEAAAQLQKGLDHLALLPDNPQQQRQELKKPVLRRLRGVWRCRCRQVVTAERHLYGDRDPVLETSKLPNSAGNRWFESISLQRRVGCELGF